MEELAKKYKWWKSVTYDFLKGTQFTFSQRMCVGCARAAVSAYACENEAPNIE